MRKLADVAFTFAVSMCAIIALAVFALIGTAILGKGLPAVNWRFLVESIGEAGASGGVADQIIGTLILGFTAIALAAPAALGFAIAMRFYVPGDAWRRRLLLVLYLLNGVPSLLFGIFGFIVFTRGLGWGKSWLAGGIVLGFMILPTVTVAVTDRIRSIPFARLEAAVGLGLTRAQVIHSVVIPRALSGVATGGLLGVARAVGETAPIHYTATVFSGASIPTGIRENPVLSLPYHIFVLAQDAFEPSARERVWATAVVLLGLVAVLSLIALPFRWRAHEEARHA
jgi:phosphate transport system permease protein